MCLLASVTALQVHGGRPDMVARARSATALQVQGGRSYVAARTRAAPAIARLGTSSSNTGPLDEQELLRELTELEPTLSYKGWQEDAAESEKYYTLTYLALLVKKMSEMRHKQQRHGDVHGVRSDPLLRDLDELKATLSYDGWHEDAAEVEKVYITCPEHSRGSMDQMRRKQQLHDARKVTVPQPPIMILKLLRELDPLFTEDELEYAFSYDGWQADAAEMSMQYLKDPYFVPGMIAEMRRRQVYIHGYNRVERRVGGECENLLEDLLELNNGTLSYEGWQEDVVQASVHCISAWYSTSDLSTKSWDLEELGVALTSDVSEMIAQMHRKQQLHDPQGERSDRVPLLQELDELKGTLTYEGWQKDVARTTVECLGDPWDVPDKIAGMRHRQQVHVSSGRADGSASGYERSYTDDGTLQIYIPPSGVTVLGGASASGAVAASVFASGSLLRTVALAAGTASAVMPLLCIPVCVVGAGFVLKRSVFDPATGTKLTIGRHAWSLVQRTAAGVVTREEDGATEDIASLDYFFTVDGFRPFTVKQRLIEFSLQAPRRGPGSSNQAGAWLEYQDVQFKAVLPRPNYGNALVEEVNAQLKLFQALELAEQHLHALARQKSGTDHGGNHDGLDAPVERDGRCD